MTERRNPPKASSDEKILQEQFLRALSSFEGIILSQIDIKNRLGDRLNYAIQAGIIILGAIAFSILVLLLTLTSQVNQMTGVVQRMNGHFTSISDRMHQITNRIASMEQRVALVEGIKQQAAVMDQQMVAITEDVESMRDAVGGIGRSMAGVRANVGNISATMDLMNQEVQAMSVDMARTAQPARSLNKMFPFP